MAKRKRNYMRLSSVEAARTEHGMRSGRARSSRDFKAYVKTLPAAARRMVIKARRAAIKSDSAEAKKAMKAFERELRETRRYASKSRGKSTGGATKASGGIAKGIGGALSKLKKLVTGSKVSKGRHGTSSRKVSGAADRLHKARGSGKHFKDAFMQNKRRRGNPSLSMIPGYDLVMSGPIGEALTYVPGAALGVAGAVVFSRFLPSWNVGWKGIALRFVATALLSGTVGHFVSRKHGVAVAIGGLVATVVEGVNLWLSPGSKVRSAFDLSGLADSVGADEIDGVILDPGDEFGSAADDAELEDWQGSMLTGDVDSLVSTGDQADSVAELADLAW